MNLGRRDKDVFPKYYRGFRLFRSHGLVYAIPPSVDAKRIIFAELVFDHPAVLKTATLDEAREAIDRFDPRTLERETVGRYRGYDLVRFRGRLHALPHGAGDIDLDIPDDRRRAGVLTGDSRTEVEELIRTAGAATPVEFAGWLPVYEASGNCGQHPQFAHTDDPPPGYRFTCSAPKPPRGPSIGALVVEALLLATIKVLRDLTLLLRIAFAFIRPRRGVSIRARLRVLVAMVRMIGYLLWRGCRFLPTLRFVQTRHLQSQLLLANRRGPVFLTSMPYTFGQDPWAIEIEDPTTLFYPFLQNGQTSALAIADSPYYAIVKALLEADHCKAILTHMRSTADLIPTLFKSESISRKVVYQPLGVRRPARWQRHEPRPADAPIHLLFINSWCQVPDNFRLRGGLEILEAFATLRERYPQLRLTIRTGLPLLDDHYLRIIEQGWVRIIDRFTTAEEMANLHASSDIFLLPAARIHIVSLLQAMSYGLAVVASDGWGMEEYITHERNGLIVKGRYGKVSWADEEAGLLREDYDPLRNPDPLVVEGIIEAVSRLVEDVELRRRLGRAARQDVETSYTIEQWNEGMRRAIARIAPTFPPPSASDVADIEAGAEPVLTHQSR
jgi:glycosyltransferase involved in cell wall biosynthesis